MAETLASTLEKYQFWVFTLMATLLIATYQAGQKDIQRQILETRHEIIQLSRSMAVLTTKLDNYELAQKNTQTEIREINSRLSAIEMKMARFENERENK